MKVELTKDQLLMIRRLISTKACNVKVTWDDGMSMDDLVTIRKVLREAYIKEAGKEWEGWPK